MDFRSEMSHVNLRTRAAVPGLKTIFALRRLQTCCRTANRVANDRFMLACCGTMFATLLVFGCSAPAPSPQIVVNEIKTSSGVEMVLIPGGTFSMGSGSATEPAHSVELSPFAIDKYEVTQDQLAFLETSNPSQFKGERRPAEQIRWTDAATICNKRSVAEGLEPCYEEVNFKCSFDANGYRLPTEAEWEYAARAGETAVAASSLTADQIEKIACYSANSNKQTSDVGSRRANAWGLFDMLGNVAEWCNDTYAEDFYSRSPPQDPRGPSEGAKKVLRGGSWNSPQRDCSPTVRRADDSGISDACYTRPTNGFRCVRRLTEAELASLAAAK